MYFILIFNELVNNALITLLYSSHYLIGVCVEVVQCRLIKLAFVLKYCSPTYLTVSGSGTFILLLTENAQLHKTWLRPNYKMHSVHCLHVNLLDIMLMLKKINLKQSICTSNELKIEECSFAQTHWIWVRKWLSHFTLNAFQIPFTGGISIVKVENIKNDCPHTPKILMTNKCVFLTSFIPDPL